MKRILMIAYHFPPLAGSSGIQRTLRFARYLPELGWEPIVLTAHPRAYQSTSQDLLQDVPPNIRVHRAQAWDAARHFSLFGRYPKRLARPDRWASWKLDAVRIGRNVIREARPDVIWSTYPIATAHVIGQRLHRLTGVPWIADFRDPMAQEGYPADPTTWQQFKDIEEAAAQSASAMVFTTPGARAEYAERYPDAAHRMHTIENGYDEEPFAHFPAAVAPLVPGKLTLVHSGVMYPSERDPRCFLDALKRLREDQPILAAGLCVRFRASAHDQFLAEEVGRRGLAEIVETAPPVSYRAALEEMCRADGLLVMQASNCNQQIPAKLYEYFRAGRPILALTDPQGDTAATVRRAGIVATAALDDSAEISALLQRFIANRADPRDFLPSPEYVADCSRQARTRELAALLDSITSSAR